MQRSKKRPPPATSSTLTMKRRLSNSESSPPPVSAPSLKLTKSESMLRVRKKLNEYSSSCLRTSNCDKFKFRFEEGINQLTFKDDERFRDENIFFGDIETVSHKHVRERRCRGLTTHVEGQRLRVGDNVNANFKAKGRWYPAHVVKVNRGKYDVQYAGTPNPKP